MQKLFGCIAFAGLAATFAVPAQAGELKLSMAGGRVTLIADQVPVRQILDEWARVGQTKIVNSDKVVGPPLTLQIVDQPEGEVLQVVLRSVAGYMAAPRPVDQPGPSFYDRIVILATSRAPAAAAIAPPAPFSRPMPLPQHMPTPVDDDDGDPGEQGVVPPPGMMQPGMQQPQEPVMQSQPGIPAGQQPYVLPRPGMIPAPQQPQQGPNPFVPRPNPNRPGGGRPGGEG